MPATSSTASAFSPPAGTHRTAPEAGGAHRERLAEAGHLEQRALVPILGGHGADLVPEPPRWSSRSRRQRASPPGELDASAGARLCQCIQVRNDLGGLVQHGRHYRARGAIAQFLGEPLGERVDRAGGNAYDRYESSFGQPVELPSHAVKLAVRGHDAWAVGKGERRQPACHQLVGVLAERDIRGVVTQQPGEPGAHVGRTFFGALSTIALCYAERKTASAYNQSNPARRCRSVAAKH